jgi:hypothetical protein
MNVTNTASYPGSKLIDLQVSGSSVFSVDPPARISLSDGHHNNSIGEFAGNGLTTGDQNTFIGYQAGMNVTTGRTNTIIGSYQHSAALISVVVIANGDGLPVVWAGEASANYCVAVGTYAGNLVVPGLSIPQLVVIVEQH